MIYGQVQLKHKVWVMPANSSQGSVEEQLSILQAAVEIEEFGIKFYGRLEQCVAEEEGKALMRSLAKDEGKHKEIIQTEMARIKMGGEEAKADRRFADIVPERVFESLPQGRCLTVKEEIQALQIGMDVERRSIEMYEKAAANALAPEVKAMLKKLAHIEEGHLKLLEDNAYQLRMEGSWYGYTPILEG